MKKELREQIKRDELVTGFQNAAAWAQAHQQELRIAVGVAVLVGAAAAGLAYVQGNRQREAERAFMEAGPHAVGEGHRPSAAWASATA